MLTSHLLEPIIIITSDLVGAQELSFLSKGRSEFNTNDILIKLIVMWSNECAKILRSYSTEWEGRVEGSPKVIAHCRPFLRSVSLFLPLEEGVMPLEEGAISLKREGREGLA